MPGNQRHHHQPGNQHLWHHYQKLGYISTNITNIIVKITTIRLSATVDKLLTESNERLQVKIFRWRF